MNITLVETSTCLTYDISPCLCLSLWRNIGKHIKEFVLHGMGVLVNCTKLSRLLELSSALVVCLTAKKEGRSLNEDKTLLLAAIDRISPAELDALCAQKEKQSQSDDASLEMEETLSVKIRDISPFSRALKRKSAAKLAKLDEKPEQPVNLLNCTKVVEYLQTYIFPLALIWSGILLGNWYNCLKMHRTRFKQLPFFVLQGLI